MKNILTIILSFLCASGFSTDINRNITFQDNQTLFAAQLHQLIDGATISTQFYTTKPADPSVPATDVFLVYSPTLGGFYKATASQVIYANTTIFTTLSETTFAQTNDWVMLYSRSNATTYVINPINLVSNSLHYAFKSSTNQPSASFALYGYYGPTNDSAGNFVGGTNAMFSLSQVYQEGLQISTWTNLPTITAPSPTDTFTFWQSPDQTNYTLKATTRIAQYTNTPVVSNTIVYANPTPTLSTGTVLFAVMPQVYGVTNTVTVTNIANSSTVTNIYTNSVIALSGSTIVSNAPIQLLTLGQIQNWLTNNPVPTYPTVFTSPLSVSLITGLATNFSHGFTTTPSLVRCVLICQTADVGYTAGDEVDASGFNRNDGTILVTYGGNTTNVFFTIQNAGTLSTLNKSSGAQAAITLANWKAKLYAQQNLKP